MQRIARSFIGGVAAAALGASLLALPSPALSQHSKPKVRAVKKKAPKITYKAQCGMTYTEAQAKKHKFICPMDKKPLKKVVSK